MKIEFLKNCVNYISTPVIPVNERVAHSTKVKVAAIALAIFTCGIFALASLAYTGYQQYKAKQAFIKPPDATGLDDSDEEEINEKDKLIEDIYAFAERFLHPYITGAITAANDDPNREPLIDLIREEFNGVEDIDLEEEALKAYLEVAAMGLYVNRKAGKNVVIKTESPEFQMLKQAVSDALPKDFPDLELSDDELDQKVKDAFATANKRRTDANSHPVGTIDPNAASIRAQKAGRLNKDNLFLEN